MIYYDIFTYIWFSFMVNVGKYIIYSLVGMIYLVYKWVFATKGCINNLPSKLILWAKHVITLVVIFAEKGVLG